MSHRSREQDQQGIVTALGHRLARAQVAHPYWFLGLGVAVTVIAGATASRLHIDSSYEALLPPDTPQLQEVNDARDRTGGSRQVVVAISGADEAARVAFGRRLLARLEGLDGVRSAELTLPVGFLRERALWLLDDGTFDDLMPALELAVERFRDGGDVRGLGLAWTRLRYALENGAMPLSQDGLMRSRDGRYLFLIIVPSISFWDPGIGAAFIRRVDAAIASADPGASGVEVELAGNIMVMQEQQQIMTRDLRNASLLALVLGVLLIAAALRRPLAPLLIGGSLLVGVIWTFAFAEIIFGRLNVITGFLVSVLIGLGIDFGIHLMVRYLEERRRDDGVTAAEATSRAVSRTFAPALTSALTTAGTFFTFAFAEFRGFSEFGVLAGIGVTLTLASSFLFLPPLLLVTQRLARSARQRSIVDALLSGRRLGVWPALVIVALFGGAAVYGAFHVRDIPFRNDFARLRGRSEATEFTRYVNANLGSGLNPAVIIVDTEDEAERAEAVVRAQAVELDRQTGGPRIRRTASIADILPHDSPHRRRALERLGQLLADPQVEARAAGDETLEAHLALARSMAAATPWSVDDIPPAFRHRFMTLDERQFIVYVWPGVENDTDLRAVAWQRELETIDARLRHIGIHALIADETSITGWVYLMVLHDGPRLLAMAFSVVLLFLLIDLRSIRRTVLVVTPLVTGMLILAGVLHLIGLELNLFNIIVLPTLIGTGIDNCVHLYHRYRSEGRGSALLVVQRTGTAAVLASTTTAVGFGSALVAHHLGLRTMGELAIIGMTATLASAILFLPSLLTLVERALRR